MLSLPSSCLFLTTHQFWTIFMYTSKAVWQSHALLPSQTKDLKCSKITQILIFYLDLLDKTIFLSLLGKLLFFVLMTQKLNFLGKWESMQNNLPKMANLKFSKATCWKLWQDVVMIANIFFQVFNLLYNLSNNHRRCKKEDKKLNRRFWFQPLDKRCSDRQEWFLFIVEWYSIFIKLHSFSFISMIHFIDIYSNVLFCK